MIKEKKNHSYLQITANTETETDTKQSLCCFFLYGLFCTVSTTISNTHSYIQRKKTILNRQTRIKTTCVIINPSHQIQKVTKKSVKDKIKGHHDPKLLPTETL